MDYFEWNFLLTRYYFNKDMAGREVLLYADVPTINAVGEANKVGVEDFIKAVKIGSNWVTRSGLCQKALQTFYNWRGRGFKYPPYIAYLVLFVLAAGTEGDFATTAYYPRLRKLLGEPEDSGQPASFSRMLHLWNDLQKWTSEDRLETLGRFTARVRGNWIHVGLPLSQTLLTTEERSNLPVLFTENNFDPTSPPAEGVLSTAIENSRLVQLRTRKLLRERNDENSYLRNALLELVLDELREWDGVAPDLGKGDTQQTQRAHGVVKICLEYDPLSQFMKTKVRFKSNRQFPEEEFQFRKVGTDSIWICRESSSPSWTTPFTAQENNKPLDATSLDWDKGELFIDETTGWNVKLRPAEVRVFVPGAREGIHGWVEVSKIDSNLECIIACNDGQFQAILNWGQQCCTGFMNLKGTGLPDNWHAFKLHSVQESHPSIEILKLPTLTSLRFKGGIKTGRGNTYFKFAPPHIVVEGVKDTPVIRVGGNEIKEVDDSLWKLPDNLPVDTPISVVLDINGETLKSMLVLKEPSLLTKDNVIHRDRFGKIIEHPDPDCSISGVEVSGSIVDKISSYPFQIPTYLSHRIVFLGSKAGQIVNWPDESIPDGWTPVWAVAKIRRDKWKAYFIGDPEKAMQPPDKLTRTLYDWKKWKSVFKLNVVPPGLTKLVQLWRSYKKEAEKL